MTRCPYCHKQLTRTHQDLDDPQGWPTCPTHGVLDDLDLRPNHTRGDSPMTTTDPDTLLVSIDEARRRLGVARRTVELWIETGELRTVQGAKRRYVYAADLAAYAEPKAVGQ